MNQPNRQRTNLVLNAVPIDFDSSAVIRVGRLPYEDHEKFRDLQDRLRGTHVLCRRRNEIEVAALGDDQDLPGTINEIAAGKVIHLLANLLSEQLINHFSSLGRRVFRRNRGLIIVSEQPQDDLLAKVVRNRKQLPSWLGFRVAYRLNVRVEYPNGKPQMLIAIGTQAHTQIDGSITELLSEGVEVGGLYVVRSYEIADDRVAPGTRLTGRIVRVVGDTLELDDFDEGCESIPAANAKLEPRMEVLAHVISNLAGEQGESSSVLSQLRSMAGLISGGKEKLARVQALASYLKKQSIWLAPNLSFNSGDLLNTNSHFPSYEVIPKPAFIFDPGGRHTQRWNQGGLDQHGPFDKFQFTPKHLNIAVVCLADLQGRVERFADQLLHGVANAKYGGDVGFLRRFALEKPYIRVFRAAGSTPQDYHKSSVDAIEHITDQGRKWDLALVQTDKEMELLEGDQNPYLISKSFFLSKGVAVQHFHHQTIEQADQQRAYSLNNIGLACYAKLGGVPWLLPTDHKVAHELVIGLGSYHEKKSRFGSSDRYVGITTVFSGDGRYLLESRTRSVTYNEYRTALLDAVRSAVNQVREDYAWADDDPVRLVFHAFKPLKDMEVVAVQSLVKELKLPHVEYAFVHVADNHPFQVFDTAQEGAWAVRNSRKGIYAPPRGLVVKISNRDVLLCLKGAKELRQASDGHPEPLALHLHRASSFTDLTYLARQANAFSCHSWRSFLPAPLPITILYSELVARNLQLLSKVSGWSEDSIVGRIGRTRWFL